MEDEGNCCQKKCFGDDGAHNSLQIPLKVCSGCRPHGICGHFRTIDVHKTPRGFKNPLHAAENVHFVSFRQGPRAPVLPCFYPNYRGFLQSKQTRSPKDDTNLLVGRIPNI